jgi:hypothetical protein
VATESISSVALDNNPLTRLPFTGLSMGGEHKHKNSKMVNSRRGGDEEKESFESKNMCCNRFFGRSVQKHILVCFNKNHVLVINDKNSDRPKH